MWYRLWCPCCVRVAVMVITTVGLKQWVQWKCVVLRGCHNDGRGRVVLPVHHVIQGQRLMFHARTTSSIRVGLLQLH